MHSKPEQSHGASAPNPAGGGRPLVSVVTVCLNSAKTIRQTIESVLGQTYPSIEYIIIDGGSRDDTLSIVNEYRDRIAVVVSEKDEGISDAFNKGIRRATGEYVQILNADDSLSPEKIDRSVAILEAHPDAAYVFGDIEFLSADGSTELVQGNRRYERTIGRTMTVMNHPTMLVRRSAYERYGGFEKQWRIAMDYDWILRLHRNGEKGTYSSDVVVRMHAGGTSDRNRIRAFREVRDISLRHGLSPAVAYPYYWLRCIKHGLLKLIGKR